MNLGGQHGGNVNYGHTQIETCEKYFGLGMHLVLFFLYKTLRPKLHTIASFLDSFFV